MRFGHGRFVGLNVADVKPPIVSIRCFFHRWKMFPALCTPTIRWPVSDWPVRLAVAAFAGADAHSHCKERRDQRRREHHGMNGRDSPRPLRACRASGLSLQVGRSRSNGGFFSLRGARAFGECVATCTPDLMISRRDDARSPPLWTATPTAL